MESAEKKRLIEELKKHRLCVWYWPGNVEEELDQNMILEYEPIGDMGVYSRYLEFHAPYNGENDSLKGTRAVIRLGITAHVPVYDMRKAMEGTDCFHNVWIKVYKGDRDILDCNFQLWSKEEERYSGEESELKAILLG